MNDLNKFERLFMALLIALLCVNLLCVWQGA